GADTRPLHAMFGRGGGFHPAPACIQVATKDAIMLRNTHAVSPLALLTFLAAPAAAAAEESAARFDIRYIADVMSNLSGGLETGSRYMDNLDLSLEVDAERAMGWNGATLFLYGVYNNGKALSG